MYNYIVHNVKNNAVQTVLPDAPSGTVTFCLVLLERFFFFFLVM
jgi:hypothetical protein